MQTFEDLGDLQGTATAQNNLGNLCADRGDSLRAMKYYSSCLEARRHWATSKDIEP